MRFLSPKLLKMKLTLEIRTQLWAGKLLLAGY